MNPSNDNPQNPPPPPALRPDFQLLGDMDELPQQQPGFPIRRVLGYLLRLWWLPVVTLILGLGIAAALVWKSPPTFVSKASMVETVKLRLPEGSMFTEDVQTSAGTQTELLKSKALGDMALARITASSNGVSVPRGPDGDPLPVDIKVSANSKSSVFGLQATSSKSAYTRAYLDALMNVYLEYKRNMRKVVSGDTLASITEQVQRAERDLRAEQDILTAFQRTNNFAILQEEGTIAGGYLARLKTQMSDLELEKRLLQGSLDSADTGASGTNASPDWVAAINSGPGVSSSPVATERQNAYQELELLKMQRERLSRSLRPKHPKIVKLDTDIDRAGRLLEIYRRQNRDQLLASMSAIQMKIENVQASIKQWEGKVIDANTRIGEAERLRLNVQRAQSVYERLALLVQNVGISRNIDQETLAILEPATPPERSYNREFSIAALGCIGGLGLGLAVIILLALRDDRFTSSAEITEKVGQVIVGQVPQVSGLDPDSTSAVLQIDDPRHIYSESFRNLRSALMFMPGPSGQPRVLLVTSAIPNEGKSTVAANLARALAFGGARVLLIDADMRKGVLHRLIGLKREPGLAEALTGDGDTSAFIQTNCITNLDFIGTGVVSRHSGDLLLDGRFDRLLKLLRGRYDYIVLDSSPVFATDDATTLAPKMDGTLFVVRNGFSRLGQVKPALEQLYLRNARVLGVVFNQADSSGNAYYYKYAEYYGKAHGADKQR
jgi:polysaccharide biosynthesis transport protein